jgi:hypothetical protein
MHRLDDRSRIMAFNPPSRSRIAFVVHRRNDHRQPM